MSDIVTTVGVMPSATSSEAEIPGWRALPRDEQPRRLRIELDHPGCKRVSTASMADIRAEGQALAAHSRSG